MIVKITADDIVEVLANRVQILKDLGDWNGAEVLENFIELLIK